ncbi:hypothetical protein HZS55_16255 [Halosimplex rubrum]|uniref:YjeF C-terminal domain-containing protein n=1 Tax=Halosimplex rubrum TaxID=869889 RepID=A0A7D5T1A8_9EURY|nr:NAD(P)H-hydrate dehydratase [Halosimplex rubrum]QLH78748.1 hypothetical protein HZS55_16255 [Halosimplex rubrum]
MEELLAELADGDDSEKGDSGRVGVVGGSIEFAGPPALSGLAALRTGTDVLRPDSVGKVLAVAEWSDALVVGPGLETPTPKAVREIVDRVAVPTVVDATAIEHALECDLSGSVVTPDSAEVERIEAEHGSLASSARYGSARRKPRPSGRG